MPTAKNGVDETSIRTSSKRTVAGKYRSFRAIGISIVIPQYSGHTVAQSSQVDQHLQEGQLVESIEQSGRQGLQTVPKQISVCVSE